MLEVEKKKKGGLKKSKRRKQEESQENDADIEAQILAKKGISPANIRCQIQTNNNCSFMLMRMFFTFFGQQRQKPQSYSIQQSNLRMLVVMKKL